MWLFTQHGFVSITVSTDDPNAMQLRFREHQDAANFKALAKLAWNRDADILETPQADYRWRIICEPGEATIMLAYLAEQIDYRNFKGRMSTLPDQRPKMHDLHRVWHIMHDRQRNDPFLMARGTLKGRIMQAMKSGRYVTVAEVARAAKCSHFYAWETLKKLVKEGKAERRILDGGAQVYRYTAFELEGFTR